MNVEVGISTEIRQPTTRKCNMIFRRKRLASLQQLFYPKLVFNHDTGTFDLQ